MLSSREPIECRFEDPIKFYDTSCISCSSYDFDADVRAAAEISLSSFTYITLMSSCAQF